MGKFTERIFFFVLTPITFLWWGMQVLIHPEQCAYAKTAGCAIGALSVPFIMAFLVASIGLAIRHRRIKKEKQTKPANNQ